MFYARKCHVLFLLLACLTAGVVARAGRSESRPDELGPNELSSLDFAAVAGRSLLQMRPSMNQPIFSDMERGGYSLQSRQFSSGTRMQAPPPQPAFRGRSGLMLAPLLPDGRRLAAVAPQPQEHEQARGVTSVAGLQQKLATLLQQQQQQQRSAAAATTSPGMQLLHGGLSRLPAVHQGSSPSERHHRHRKSLILGASVWQGVAAT